MPFGTISRTGPGIRQVLGFGNRSTGRGTFRGAFGRVIVTNGDFTAYVCNSAATRPSSQITLGKLVVFLYVTRVDYEYELWAYSLLYYLDSVCR